VPDIIQTGSTEPFPSLSIVVTTVGRPTLIATLESLRQLAPADELLLITDGDHPGAFTMLDHARLACRTQRIVHRPAARDWGHRLRNLYSSRASGERVLHLDDDDVYLDGAISRVRQVCAQHPGKLVVFQMLIPGGRVPMAHRLCIGNIGTSCGALPNEPARWGCWEPFYGGDGAFYQSCQFDVIWCDEPICAIQPHAWDAPSSAKCFVHPTHRVEVAGSIPKVLHRIWLGGRPLPDEFVRFGATWLRLNPDWQLRTWTEENLPELVNRVEYDAAPKVAFKADILRYELLWRYGGVYIDTDFDALKPLGDLFDDINAFFADEGPNTPSIGILGCIPGDPFYRHLIEVLPRSYREHPGDVHKTGPPFFAREIDRFFGADRYIRNLGRVWEHISRDLANRMYGFESRFFFPYGYGEQHRRHELFPDAFAVHHWAHSWR
jgi:hypothetical protein